MSFNDPPINMPPSKDHAHCSRCGKIMPIRHGCLPESFRLNTEKTVAVAADVYFNEDMSTCPRGVKLQLLGDGGVAQYGIYTGDPFWIGWAPVPRRMSHSKVEIPSAQPAPEAAPIACFGLSVQQIDNLRTNGLKPEEIAGGPDTQLDRVRELVWWFARLAEGNANPKWLRSHAFELAYYIACMDVKRQIDLGPIRQAAFLQGMQVAPEERRVLERCGAIPPAAPAATQAQAEPALWVNAGTLELVRMAGKATISASSEKNAEEGNGTSLYTRPAIASAPVGDGAATQPAGEEAHPDIAKLRSAVNLALTYFGMDEDESNREVFKALREAYAHAASLPEHIDRIATVFGSLRKMAEALDIDVGYLSRLRSGEKADPSDEILATLGLRRTVTYTKVRTGPYEATPLIPRTRSA